MVEHFPISIQARPRGIHLITDEVLAQLPDLPGSALLNLFILHTSAGLGINEAAAPEVRIDMQMDLERLIPDDHPDYFHTEEGPDDMAAHSKSVLVGAQLCIPIRNGQLWLGRWQGIYLFEFRNAGTR